MPRWLQATTRPLSSVTVSATAASMVVILLALASWSLSVSPGCWLVLGGIVACGVLIAASEPRRVRLVSVNLFALALALRVLALVVFRALANREGGPFLGPDSTGYFEGATELIARGFHLDTIPLLFFGSYDVAHYYLFAAAMRLHADLFALQLLNVGFTAIAAPLAYIVARHTVPRGARVAGLLVALSPSLVVLSAVDMLKDPSVVFATLLALACIIRLARATSVTAIALSSAVLLGPLLYLRTARFYSFAYIEAAVCAALVWIAVRRHRLAMRTWTAVAALALVFATVEWLPTRAGWPPSPVLMLAQIGHVLGTPSMRFYSAGLVERFRHQQPAEQTGRQSIVAMMANTFRRVFGPFPWILPETWSWRALQGGDYLLYPGMLLWYCLLPFVVVGLLVIGRGALSRAPGPFALIFLWVFTAVYFLQYLAINLSYRQRDVMFPVLVIFACVGWDYARRGSAFPRWYVAYWTALGLLAAAHLSVRAWLGA